MMNHLTAEQLDAFVASIRGNVVRPGDGTYDDARAIYNGMIDKKPSMIVQVSDVADVMTAVKFCAENKVSVAVRSGGHNGEMATSFLHALSWMSFHIFSSFSTTLFLLVACILFYFLLL